jgi:hypothetical protein
MLQSFCRVFEEKQKFAPKGGADGGSGNGGPPGGLGNGVAGTSTDG